MAEPSNPDDTRPAWAGEILDAVRSLDAKFDAKFDSLSSDLRAVSRRVTDLETAATDIDNRLSAIEARLQEAEKIAKSAALTAQDAASKIRRCQVRIVGVPEAPNVGRMSDFVSTLLTEVLGTDILSSPSRLEWAYRIPTSRPGDPRPRTIIAQFHHLRIKETVIREARQKRSTLVYRGAKIAIYDDFAAEIAAERATYRDVIQALWRRGLRPALLYPARLRVTTKDGKIKFIRSVAEAKEVLSTLPDP